MALDWVHEPRGTAWWKAALRTALHWLGVLVAIELVYVFIDAGRLTNADTGLLNGDDPRARHLHFGRSYQLALSR